MKNKILYIQCYTPKKTFSVLPNYGSHRTSSFQVFQEYFQGHEKL